MSRSFDIKLDKLSESYQTFNMCAVHFKISPDNFFNMYTAKVMNYMKMSLLYNCLNLFRKFIMLRTHSGCKHISYLCNII